ncbi:hypothetical protein [Chryseobacterium flavum]|uniref:hypothetical protein n=1 Tax=Chryseobacterium flavum TaxID=415851 RepID=UPI0028B1533B|nr:hypothetical protein [Chryseobacterium flavum]
MRTFFFLISSLSITFSNAQDLKAFSVPEGYAKITESKGDLDKDGNDEIVMIFNTTQRVSENKEYPKDKDYKRVLYILKNENGNLKIWKENAVLLLSSGTGFYPEDNIPEIRIKSNVLIISQHFFTNSRHTQNYRHSFRFQKGDFYLIGSYDNFEDTCSFSFLREINFSTGKVIINKDFSSCDDEVKIPENVHKEFTHTFNALIKMNDFQIGKNRFKIPGSNEYFIF